MKTALITGITGQDGSYLTELLISKGYSVHGIVRRSSTTVRARLDHLFHREDIYNKRLFLHYADLADTTTIRRIMLKCTPDELYHLAGQSHVGASFDIPETTCEFTAMGTLKLLEIIRDLEQKPKFLHISSSEIFGRPDQSPQNEMTPMRPVTPYGIAKAFATQMVTLYRESFGLFACNAICYNHESPLRGESFVTRKITRAAAAIARKHQESVSLGSLDGRRDWGFAAEYVDAMWRMLQHDHADDFVLATGTHHSVKDFLDASFKAVDLDWQDFVKQDPRYMRPSEGTRLVGDASKAERELGWKAETTLPKLAELMVEADLQRIDASETKPAF
ncbi:GDP-mannose 4,6-dehydratase [Roseiconus lacunae]|uniref:GDP-mannose 4,6-dehydratase n=1 Tax=Roseiconus lacunae TaxID=2605694 RepID=A0ABT7PPL9_9BACT|nr:GDP-mannose 4,6-dehydratase [Roseiconus lacunae]MCD0463019.1 GDP-mannose 4,6-dehydratase [Roseiconus lacunae]MDM4018450.1 GDP-mannose 4,6-dehydratase [Roseiconus lacunae]WRQ49128.1 GDP-mannose 4,6-dehydratase [Stieleria sp. HD01]